MTSSEIPLQVAQYLDSRKYFRVDKDVVNKVLTRLSGDHLLLRNFFETYEGSFWSEHLGCELLDITEGDESIETSTQTCRVQFGFPMRFFVLTRFSAGQVVVLDIERDKVYEVDFEGGDAMLLSGDLPQRWESFEAFLKEFFIAV